MIRGSPHHPEVSIIDFGLSCKSGENIFMQGDPRDYPTYAPEVLAEQPSTFACDVFAYGCLMQEVLEETDTHHPSTTGDVPGSYAA